MTSDEQPNRIEAFRTYRQRMNARISEIDHRGVKRFFRLDSAAYEQGALDSKTKEMLGLVASAVLRCNDCIDYHLDQCIEAGWSDEELYDGLNVALVVGGSIVIPHLRHAVETIDLIRAGRDAGLQPDRSDVPQSDYADDSEESRSEEAGTALRSPIVRRK